jgi:uncharacterized metal-binding protein
LPSGAVHRKITTIVQICTLPVFFYCSFEVAVGIHIGIAISRVVNPDCDIAVNRLGIWRWLGFDAYNKLISHRSGLRVSNFKNFNYKDVWKLLFFSHFPITGTFLRFIIVLYLPLLLLILFSLLQLWMFWLILGIFIGLCESDTLHIGADVIWSGLKKMFPFLKRYDTTRVHRDNRFRPFTQNGIHYK